MTKKVWIAVGALVIGLFLTVLVTIPNLIGGVEPDDPKSLRLVVSDITVDITTQHVFASDFVRIIHLGDMEEPYVGAVEYEMYRIGEADEFWNTEWHFGCEDLGEVEIWIRALYAEDHDDAQPVRAFLTIVDGAGQCGDPMFYEGSNEEEE